MDLLNRSLMVVGGLALWTAYQLSIRSRSVPARSRRNAGTFDRSMPGIFNICNTLGNNIQRSPKLFELHRILWRYEKGNVLWICELNRHEMATLLYGISSCLAMFMIGQTGKRHQCRCLGPESGLDLSLHVYHIPSYIYKQALYILAGIHLLSTFFFAPHT